MRAVLHLRLTKNLWHAANCLIDAYLEAVWLFMSRSKQRVGDFARPSFSDDAELRVRLIVEETLEFAKACGFEVVCNGTEWIVQRSRHQSNFVEAIDGLCDLLYVIFGTFLSFGLRAWPFVEEVHRSNLTKIVNGAATSRGDGKILKPPTYEPPNLEAVLEREKEFWR